jgi:hypothetical protein
MAHTAFIAHGRDTAPRDELAKFITAIGVEDLSFATVASDLGPSPFIADIVISAFKRADLEAAGEVFPPSVVNMSYWWLVVYGFFRFTSPGQFYEGDGEHWKDSVEFTQFALRGLELIERCRCGMRFAPATLTRKRRQS